MNSLEGKKKKGGQAKIVVFVIFGLRVGTFLVELLRPDLLF